MDFSSELIVKKTVKNTPSSDGSLLFFSGGLDSTYSLHEHLDTHPRMLMIGGYDMYMNEGIALEIRDKWHRIYSKFAKDIGQKINFAYTNSRWIVNEDMTQRVSGKRMKEQPYWGFLRHGVCLNGIAAPLSDRFGEMISSANGTVEWDTTTKDNPFGTGVNIDPMFAYGGMENHYHGSIDRFRKALRMRDFLNSGVVTLRVCYKPCIRLNCMICEKCLRTLAQLTVAGVDPSKCGLHAGRKQWNLYLDMFKNHKITRRLTRIHYLSMQKYLNENDVKLPEVSEEFFDYVKTEDFEDYIENRAKR